MRMVRSGQVRQLRRETAPRPAPRSPLTLECLSRPARGEVPETPAHGEDRLGRGQRRGLGSHQPCSGPRLGWGQPADSACLRSHGDDSTCLLGWLWGPSRLIRQTA